MNQALQLHRDRIIEITRVHGASNIRIIKSNSVKFLMNFEAGRSLCDLVRVKLELEDLLCQSVSVYTPKMIDQRFDIVVGDF